MVLPASQFISRSDEGHYLWAEGHLNPESNLNEVESKEVLLVWGVCVWPPELPASCGIHDLEQTTSRLWVPALLCRAGMT